VFLRILELSLCPLCLCGESFFMNEPVRPPITDSPWFWVLAFSLMGLLALFVIGGKYGRRQAGMERQYQARERIAAAGPEGAAELSPRPYATPDDTLIPLWPLSVALGAAAILATIMLVRGRLKKVTAEQSPEEAHGP
jgi:hypothetical protein